MYARHKLKTRGYIVLRTALPTEMADHMRSVSREPNVWIQDTWNGITHDDYRCKAFLPDVTARQASLFLKPFYKTFFSEASATEWRFLKSAGGSPDQCTRREFLSVTGSEALNVCAIPRSIFVALQDSTYFYGYGWNNQIALRSSQTIIELNKGDIIMFRGDYLFGAAGSAATNVIVHAFLNIPLYVRPTYSKPHFVNVLDDTRDVDDVFWYVYRCPFVATDQRSLQQHLNRYHRFFYNRPRAR